MRIESKTTKPGADRQVGPLASLMRAAEPLEELTALERERVRRRLRMDVLFCNGATARFRWSTVLAAVGLLLAGGAVFAAAGHFGLIPWPRETRPQVDNAQETNSVRRRQSRAVRGKSAVASAPVATVSEEDSPEMVAALAPPALAAPSVADPVVAPSYPAAVALGPDPRLAMLIPASSRKSVRSARVSRPQPAVAEPGATTNQLVPDRAAQNPVVSPLSPPPVSPPTMAEPVSAVPPSEAIAPEAGRRLAMLAPAGAGQKVLTVRASPATPASVPSAAADPQAMLGQALRSLRADHDATGALEILDRHAALFPRSPLSSERSVLEVEALLALGRRDEALIRLDGMSFDNIPRSAERHVVRGELRARARRWGEAVADFDQALAHAGGTRVWQERALWGRAVARARAGDVAAARGDLQSYLQLYPTGRFASEAARLLAAAE